VEVIRADSLNVLALINADAVVIEQPALSRMEEVYA
jgi:ribosomal protein L4